MLTSLGLRLLAFGTCVLWLFFSGQQRQLCSCYGLLLASMYYNCYSNQLGPARPFSPQNGGLGSGWHRGCSALASDSSNSRSINEIFPLPRTAVLPAMDGRIIIGAATTSMDAD